MIAIVLFVVPACRQRADGDGRQQERPATTMTTLSTSPTSAPADALTAPAGRPDGQPHPRTGERVEDRRRMVDGQIMVRGIRDVRVIAAMRNVPRHWFVPEPLQGRAYDDCPLPIGFEQTISQPYIVALMTELLEVKPSDKVLEIGTGSGYQAAVLSELADAVYTIEIVEPLAKRTMEVFEQRGYTGIHTRIGDGYKGWPEAAPFDEIIVTCAADKPPPPLVEQLAVGGRMCIPVNAPGGDQELLLLRKQPDGSLQQLRKEWVRFVPMTGEAQQGRKP